MMNNCPENIIRYLDTLNCSTPILPSPKMRKLDETDTINKKREVIEYVFGGKEDYDLNSMRTGLGVSHGVPQGAPTSPLLSNLSLRFFLSQQPSVSYADDPIFFGERKFEIAGDPYYNITIHEGKSH